MPWGLVSQLYEIIFEVWQGKAEVVFNVLLLL